MSKLKLTVSIVHHDGLKMLQDCLATLYANPPKGAFEVILVDNCSTDGSREFLRQNYPSIRLIENRERKGFGENHNKAMDEASGDYILLLNDDTLIAPGAIDALIDYLDSHTDTVLAGPRLLNGDGSLQRSCYRFPSPLRSLWENLLLSAALPNSPLFGDYRAWAHDAEREVDFVSGAVMLVRAETLKRIGGFDPLFFMYAEETDWQFRMRREGGKIAFTPASVITHLGGASSEGMRSRQFCEFNRSQAKFIRKHYGLAGAAVQRCAMIFGSLFRIAVWTLLLPVKRTSAKKQIGQWSRLLKWWIGLGPHEGIAESVAPARLQTHSG